MGWCTVFFFHWWTRLCSSPTYVSYLNLPLARLFILCFSRSFWSCMTDRKLNPFTSGWYSWLKINHLLHFPHAAATCMFVKIVHLPSGFRNVLVTTTFFWHTSPHTRQTSAGIYYYHITTAVFNVLRWNLYLAHLDKPSSGFTDKQSRAQHDAFTNQKEWYWSGPMYHHPMHSLAVNLYLYEQSVKLITVLRLFNTNNLNTKVIGTAFLSDVVARKAPRGILWSTNLYKHKPQICIVTNTRSKQFILWLITTAHKMGLRAFSCDKLTTSLQSTVNTDANSKLWYETQSTPLWARGSVAHM